MNAEADDSSGELVHDNEDPVGCEEDGLAPEEIDTPEASPYGRPRCDMGLQWSYSDSRNSGHNIRALTVYEVDVSGM